MKKKHILIINEYAGTPRFGMIYRHFFLAKEWVHLGYEVSIVSTPFSHNFFSFPKVNGKISMEDYEGITFYWIKNLKYKNANDPVRFLKWIQFAIDIIKVKKIIKKPVDYMIVSGSPSTLTSYNSYKLSKFFNSMFIWEVRDIWPLTLSSSHKNPIYYPMIFVLRLFELYGIKNSNKIVATMPGYGDYLSDIGIKQTNKVVWISNGIDVSSLNKNGRKKSEEAQLIVSKLKKLKTKKEVFIIGYTGTLGYANAMEYFLKAAQYVYKKEKNIYFVIVGHGKYKDTLMKTFGGLPNVIFFDPVNKDDIPNILRHFDACYIGFRNLHIYKYGYSANKVYDYMLSGCPILISYSGRYDYISENGIGIRVEAENPLEIARGVIKLYKMPKQSLIKMGEKSIRFVKENFSYEILAKRYIKEVFENGK